MLFHLFIWGKREKKIYTNRNYQFKSNDILIFLVCRDDTTILEIFLFHTQTEVECTCSAMQCTLQYMQCTYSIACGRVSAAYFQPTLQLHWNYTAYTCTLHFRLGRFTRFFHGLYLSCDISCKQCFHYIPTPLWTSHGIGRPILLSLVENVYLIYGTFHNTVYQFTKQKTTTQNPKGPWMVAH